MDDRSGKHELGKRLPASSERGTGAVLNEQRTAKNVVTLPKRCTCGPDAGCTERCTRNVKNSGNFQKEEVSGETSLAEMFASEEQRR